MSRNVELALVPIALIAVKHTMTIKASITAYSTAVGPSSETRKRCIFLASDFIRYSSIPVLAPFSGTKPEKTMWGPDDKTSTRVGAVVGLQHISRIPQI